MISLSKNWIVAPNTTDGVLEIKPIAPNETVLLSLSDWRGIVVVEMGDEPIVVALPFVSYA